jgi:hypothetical protein
MAKIRTPWGTVIRNDGTPEGVAGDGSVRVRRGEASERILVDRSDLPDRNVATEDAGFRWRGGASLLTRAQTGGRGRMGMPWPLVRMTIHRHAIAFKLPLHDPFLFPKDLISHMEMNRRSLLVVIAYTHTSDEARFWPTLMGVLSRPLRWRMTAIHGQLRDLGYDVRLARR